MTAVQDGKFALRIPAVLYWILGCVVAGVSVLASTALLGGMWSLIVGIANAMLTFGLISAQPKRQLPEAGDEE